MGMRGQELGHIHFEILWQSVFKHSYPSNQWQEAFHSWNIIISKHYPHFYSVLFNPITLEGCRGTTDEFAIIPFWKTLRGGETRDSLKDGTLHCSSYNAEAMWRDNKISLGSKVKFMCFLVISIYLYACESWPMTAELEKRTQAFEMKCHQILLDILYKDHVSSEDVCRKIRAAIGEYDEFLTLVKTRKLR